MKKHADRPCRSPGRGRLSADERLQVEGLLEHVVYRLEGKGSDRFVSFSSMLRPGVTMETVASALIQARRRCARQRKTPPLRLRRFFAMTLRNTRPWLMDIASTGFSTKSSASVRR